MDFYELVPKTLKENLEYRIKIRRRAETDLQFREALIKACREDVLFFLGAFCIAEGTTVVTDRGPVPIESVTAADRVWDGEEWVQQDGAVFQGNKATICAYNVNITPDHKVLTTNGWKQASEGYDRATIRLPDGYASQWNLSRNETSSMAVSLRLRQRDNGLRKLSATRNNSKLRMLGWRESDTRSLAPSDLRRVVRDVKQVRKPEELSLCTIWRPRDLCVPSLARLLGIFGGHGRETCGNDDRPDRQRRKLRTGKLPVGYDGGTGKQQKREGPFGSATSRELHHYSGCSHGGNDEHCNPPSSQDGTQRRAIAHAKDPKSQSGTRVYDLLNCGPRRAFAVIDSAGEPLLVHNCWLHEPRVMKDEAGVALPDVIPFLPWSHQIPIILAVRKNLGFEDIGIEKSRTEGMSWIAIYMAVHDWIFSVPGARMVSIGFVSRTREMADTPDNLASLMAKVEWAIKKMPTWMVGTERTDWIRNVTNSTLRNLRNGCTIAAYAATGEVGSGGRYTWWLIDELSKFNPGDDHKALTSTQATTNSRLIIGTPYGSDGAYHDVMHEPSSMVKLVLAWEDNPTKNRGLYRMVNYAPVAVDPVGNPLPASYDPPNADTVELFSRLRRKGFRLDRGIRSPWYDHECDRPDANPYNIAQELDRDYGGSMYRIFQDEFFKSAKEHLRQPFCQVDVDPDGELTPIVHLSPNGRLLLWMTLDNRNRPPEHPYVVGVDVATGLGGTYTSNSVIQIVDLVNMEQVGVLAANTIEPDDFADLSVAICKWLGNAYLAWERNPPGGGYSIRIKQLGYSNVYYRTMLFKRNRKKTKEPGWWTDERTKEVLFSDLKRVVTVGELKLHCSETVRECGQYVRIGKAIEFHGEKRERDNPDSGPSHGDRVMALGVAVQAMLDRPLKVGGTSREYMAPEPGTLAERDREYLESQKESTDEWDDRTNWDLARGSLGFRD